MRDEDQTHMHPANLFPQPPHSGWGNTTQYTLANSNLHEPLISFLYMIPSCKQYWKDVQRDAKYEITLTRNLITSIIINI